MNIKRLNKFEELVYKHRKDIVNFHYRLAGNKFEAEDLAQETFIKAYKKFDTLKEDVKVKSWFFSIARNVAVDFFRKNKNQPVSLDNTALENYSNANAIDQITQVASAEIAYELKQCVERLNHEDRMIIRLLYYEGFSYKEISGLLNMNTNTLKSRLHRARRSLLTIVKANNLLDDVTTNYS